MRLRALRGEACPGGRSKNLSRSNKKEKKGNGDKAPSEEFTDNAGGHLKSKTALVEKMIRNIETKLDSQEIKATLSDFIRLLQLQKELAEEKPREITVTWVEPSEKESVSSK